MKLERMGTVYAMVMHNGGCRINPVTVSLEDTHKANLIIRDNDDLTYTIIKDRYNAARLMFNLSGIRLTREQADEIVVYHVSLALKYIRT